MFVNQNMMDSDESGYQTPDTRRACFCERKEHEVFAFGIVRVGVISTTVHLFMLCLSPGQIKLITV
jgi:hypothetical protein